MPVPWEGILHLDDDLLSAIIMTLDLRSIMVLCCKPVALPALPAYALRRAVGRSQACENVNGVDPGRPTPTSLLPLVIRPRKPRNSFRALNVGTTLPPPLARCSKSWHRLKMRMNITTSGILPSSAGCPQVAGHNSARTMHGNVDC